MDTVTCGAPIESPIRQWESISGEEGLAALLTLFTRVLPTRFSKIPLSPANGAGIWINVEAGCICVNLDEVISSHPQGKPFQRSPNDRMVRIPLPLEVAKDLRRRASNVGNPPSLDQLFQRDMANLAKTTKSMLRSLSLTSHRPTLTRLSKTWARYILSLCHDEAYASGIGIDVTVGTSANFNYFTMRGARLADILGKAYVRQIYVALLPFTHSSGTDPARQIRAAGYRKTLLTLCASRSRWAGRHCLRLSFPFRNRCNLRLFGYRSQQNQHRDCPRDYSCSSRPTQGG